MTAHNHSAYVEGCFRCELSRHEVAEQEAEIVGPPVRLCCGQAHHLSRCPDGLVMCCICFDRFPFDGLHLLDNGSREDVCQGCSDECYNAPRPRRSRPSGPSTPSPPSVSPCGGCEGIGNHKRHCPRHPDYHPWRRLAEQAENIGDTIGGGSPGLANVAYGLASQIHVLIRERPFRIDGRSSEPDDHEPRSPHE